MVLVGDGKVWQQLDGSVCSWGEGARQALGQNADAVGRGVAGTHVV
jgi:exopolysaccharide biosynthesis protein